MSDFLRPLLGRSCEQLCEFDVHIEFYTPVVHEHARRDEAVQLSNRAQCMRTRLARINLMRRLLRELGIVIPQGARTALSRIPELVEDAETEIPHAMRTLLFEVLEEV